MAAGRMLSKRGWKSWDAVAYCELPGRTSVPCRFVASVFQSASVGDGGLVGLGLGVGVEEALLAGVVLMGLNV